MKYDGRIRNSKRKNYFQEKWKMKVLVIQYCPTLWEPMDCSPPGPLSMGFSRQEYWSGLPLPLGGNPWTAHCGLRIDKNKTFLTVFCFFQLGKGGAKGRAENRRGARQPPTSFHLKEVSLSSAGPSEGVKRSFAFYWSLQFWLLLCSNVTVTGMDLLDNRRE